MTVAALCRRRWVIAAAGTGLLAAAPVQAETASPAMIARLKTLMASAVFAKASASLHDDWPQIVSQMIALTQIGSPPFKEEQRSVAFVAMLRKAGIGDVTVDAQGNVTGLRQGAQDAPLLVVAAHLDTVFPAGTPVIVRREGDRLFAPGISDDSSGLTAILAFVRALGRASVRTRCGILFVGDVGEEGLGDLRGTRYLFTQGPYRNRIGMFISLEPGRGWVTNGAVGSQRLRATFRGPGGHSYGDFGLVNPAYAVGDAIARISRMQVPSGKDAPRTTYNVTLIDGGSSVNAIPAAASFTVDLRSTQTAALATEVRQFGEIVRQAAADENGLRSIAQGPITYTVEQLGNREAGLTPADATIVQVATAALNASGIAPAYYSGSTDANVPIGLGIPAITLGSGFLPQRMHSVGESVALDRPDIEAAMATTLATIIALADGDRLSPATEASSAGTAVVNPAPPVAQGAAR